MKADEADTGGASSCPAVIAIRWRRLIIWVEYIIDLLHGMLFQRLRSITTS